MMKIKNSIEWFSVEAELIAKGKKLNDDYGLLDMLRNVHRLVNKLSIEEVKLRTRRSNTVTELLDKINSDIELIEEYMLMAVLAG